METLLMIGIGQAGTAFLESARRLGVAVHAVELPERKFAYVDHISDFTDCRGLVDELWAEAADAAVLVRRPDGVLAFNEPHVVGAALVQDELGLPGPGLRATMVSHNKALQRGRFAAAGIRQPDYLVVEDLRDAREWAAERLPVVVKPLSSSGSAGVEQVPDLAGLTAVIERRSGMGKLLVEVEVYGPEFSWEAFVIDGDVRFSNVTAKETSGAPQFVELAHRTAADLSAKDRGEVETMGERVLAAMSMQTGVVHLEYRMTPDGPSVMEIAVRMPGDGLMELLELTYGLNWYDLLVMAALGRKIPEFPRQPSRYAASYLPPTTGGTVTEIQGLDDVRAHPYVISADLAVSVGDLVPTTTSSLERAGRVLMAAPTQDELGATLSYVWRSLQIVTTPA